MGGATFKDYLEKAQDIKLKNELRIIVESFKRHEEAVTHRIELLGGNAADTLGFMGMIGETLEKMKLIVVDSDREVIDYAINAMNMGVEQGNKFIAEHQDLEPNIKKEIEKIVEDNDKHLKKLKNI
ncbi:MAG: hypothetical protein MSA89_07760 [Clostridium sp.]|nr:hypothetical protein [Clostridium sp.]